MGIFELKKEHLKLISNFNITFNNNSEFGAPTVDTKRPYGNSDAYQDIARILKIKARPEDDQEFSDEQYKYMDKLHEETEIALQIVLSLQCFKTGFYCLDYNGKWSLIKDVKKL